MAEDHGKATAGVFKRAMRAVIRLCITLVVLAGAVFAVQFGALELDRRAKAAPSPEAAAVIPVTVSPLEITEAYSVQRVFVGQIEPQQTVSISFELSGKLADILVDEGDTVTQGQLLAQQDISLLQAEQARLQASRQATQAQLRFAGQTVERNEQLSARGFSSQAGLDEALARQTELTARIAEIDAGLDRVSIQIGKSTLRAPFAGRLTERLVDGGETLAAGQRVLGIVATETPQLRIGVPLEVTRDQLQTSKVAVAGETYDARLVSLRPDIDPVTRTRTALFEIDTDVPLVFGQTARLSIENDIEAKGFWLPTTSLKEGQRGQWTVLLVDAEDIVRSASVEVLHIESDRVYVRSAVPEGARLIDDGPQRVTLGQKVVIENAI
ncbi:MAG: efflux RND transporter periplasmic adaptor subunit [Pseudomonadota bacterium]